jgi:GNAT superfamily N-acetyltransferase
MDFKKLKYQAVEKGNWGDLERLFESLGGPHYCWCMLWRKMDKQKPKVAKSDRKATLKDRVLNSIPIGILCYYGDSPIAWCSIAPRDSYRNLSGVSSLTNVWSLVCFFIKKEFRKQQLTEELIREAIKYAKENGAKYLEAFPVDPDSPSYGFMGYKPTFEKMGFTFRHKVGHRRNAMTIVL